jgi:hypothetical protein
VARVEEIEHAVGEDDASLLLPAPGSRTAPGADLDCGRSEPRQKDLSTFGMNSMARVNSGSVTVSV